MSPKEVGPGRARQHAEAGIGWSEHRSDTTARARRLGRREPKRDLVEVAAQAIYAAHWRRPAPKWEQASAEVKEWVRYQARAAVAALRAANGW